MALSKKNVQNARIIENNVSCSKRIVMLMALSILVNGLYAQTTMQDWDI